MYFARVTQLWLVALLLTRTLTNAYFEMDFISKVNTYRQLHDCPKLKLHVNLCMECRHHANKLCEAGELLSSKDNENSELLCTEENPMDCVKVWYDQRVFYSYEKAEYVEAARDFTAMLWKDSTRFGVGQCVGDDGIAYVVVKIFPRGNLKSKFEYNVPRRKEPYSSKAAAFISNSVMYFVFHSWIYSKFI